MYLEHFAARMHKIADATGAGHFDEFDPEEASFGRQLREGQLPVQQGPKPGPNATVAAKPSAKAGVPAAAVRPTGTPPPIPLGHQKTMAGPAPAPAVPGRTMPGGAARPNISPLTPMGHGPTLPGMGAAAANTAKPAAAAAGSGVLEAASRAGKSLSTGWQAAGKGLASGGMKFMERPGMALKMLKTPGLGLAARAGGAARMIAPHAGLLGAGLLGAHALMKNREPQQMKMGGALLLEKQAAVLSLQHREKLPTKDFAIPARKAKALGTEHKIQGDSKGRYPIHDRVHARAALSMVAKHGTEAEKALVRAKVRSKYPDMGKQASYDHENC